MEHDIELLFGEIRNMGRALDAFERQASRALGINRSDLGALNALEHGPLSHRDIAEALDMTAGSVTTLVDRLVDAGYVERQPDPADRRRSHVALTPATYGAFAQVYRPCGEVVTAWLVDLAPDARRAATDALRLAAAAVDEAAQALAQHA